MDQLLVSGSHVLDGPQLALAVHVLPGLGPGAVFGAALHHIQDFASGLVKELHAAYGLHGGPQLGVGASGGSLLHGQAVVQPRGLQGLLAPAVDDHKFSGFLHSHDGTVLSSYDKLVAMTPALYAFSPFLSNGRNPQKTWVFSKIFPFSPPGFGQFVEREGEGFPEIVKN